MLSAYSLLTCRELQASYFLSPSLHFSAFNLKREMNYMFGGSTDVFVHKKTVPHTYLKSRHVLVYILNPVLPSRSRPDSPYKHPDSHSVGSLQLLHMICSDNTII